MRRILSAISRGRKRVSVAVRWQAARDWFGTKFGRTVPPIPWPSDELLDLATIYRRYPLEFEQLKAVTLAQWILESNWGRSNLAIKHTNFGGIKWRPAMGPYARRAIYTSTRDTNKFFCAFPDLSAFIQGYWAFLDRDPYRGWRLVAHEPHDFLRFIATRYAEDPNYADKVLSLAPIAEDLLRADDGEDKTRTRARLAQSVVRHRRAVLPNLLDESLF